MSGIVVGVDGSEHAHKALDWAMQEAAVRNTDLTVLTVVSTFVSPWTGSPVPFPGDEASVERFRQEAEEAVAKSASELGDRQPASVAVQAFVGYPAQALIDASNHADLVVVGSRGTGGFAELALGSISSHVTHHAACPVVIVPAAR